MDYRSLIWSMLALAALSCASSVAVQAASPYFEIRVVDETTGRGVPLVELETTHFVRYVTDSAGRAAILEPGLEGLATWFTVRSHGYMVPADGFGQRGFRVVVRAGEKIEIKIRRVNIAERLYRVTGEGIYRDSVLLGYDVPLRQPLLAGHVMGQDSVFALPYRGRIYWFWGDTSRPGYPLGHFRMAGATSLAPDQGGLAPDAGVDLEYFTGTDGFSRPMVPLPEEPEGVIWADGFAIVPDWDGRERLVGHFSRRKGLDEPFEQGLVLYDEKREVFDKVKSIDLAETWRFPVGHPVRLNFGGAPYLIFPQPLPTVRVPASWEAIKDGANYEAFTCLAPGTKFEKEKSHVERDEAGRALWGWKREGAPLTQAEEAELLAAGLLRPEEARFQFVDAAGGKAVLMHGGSIYWNEFLGEYVMIAVELGGTSMLGEVWFARSKELTGPWRKAVKIATHDHYSFYNPTQHPFFDQACGRLIYFEGTFVNTFSGNTHTTPRYEYNQVMYRLDLADERLGATAE